MSEHLLPGWALVQLGDVVEINPRGAHPGLVDSDLVTFVSMAAVEAGTGRADVSQVRPWSEVRKGYTTMRDGDVVFAKITPCMENGKVALLSGMVQGRGAGSTELVVLRPSPRVDAKYLLYFMLQESVRRDARAVMQGAAGQLRVPLTFLRELDFPIAPLAEQRRIVAALEEHLSALDAAVAGLERARANIRRFAEASIATAVCPRAHWPMVHLRELGAIKGGVTKGQKRRASDVTRAVPYLRVANVQRGRLDLRELRIIEATEREIAELRLQRGDVLFNEGGDRDKLGRGWVWDGEVAECIHQNHVFRARLDPSRVEPRFVSHYANSHGQRYFLEQGKQTTNLASISMTKLGALPVPVPPLEEQQAILLDVDERLAVAERTAAEIDIQLARASRLRQSILQRAFSGRLVKQHTNDEPVSVSSSTAPTATDRTGTRAAGRRSQTSPR